MNLEKKYTPECCELFELEPVDSMGSKLDNMPIAMAYVPWQRWRKTYTDEVGLKRGTIFPELDLPFLGEEVV